jgi:hypothetical protein
MVSLVTIQPANRQSKRSDEMDTEKTTLIDAVHRLIVQKSSGDTYHQQRHTIDKVQSALDKKHSLQQDKPLRRIIVASRVRGAGVSVSTAAAASKVP